MLSVIPYKPCKGAAIWLLKMHGEAQRDILPSISMSLTRASLLVLVVGCVTAVDDIVITSNDFKMFELSRLKALGGLVQAELMTSHMLFVGFSMVDPNYLRIIREVREALQPPVAASSTSVKKSQANNPTSNQFFLFILAISFAAAAILLGRRA